jgi:uncharacterized membrane protein
VRRAEVFSDGVFAIAITLLVIELPFEQVREGELSHALGEHWPSFVTFVVSFLTIGIAWLQHSAVFDALGRLDRRVLILNLLFLMGIAFLPFPTALLADYVEQSDDAATAGVVYSGTWLYVTLSLTLLWTYAVRQRLLSDDLEDTAVRGLLRQQWAITGAYAVFTVVALVSPVMTLVLYSLTAVLVLTRSDYAVLGKEPGADIVPPA